MACDVRVSGVTIPASASLRYFRDSDGFDFPRWVPIIEILGLKASILHGEVYALISTFLLSASSSSPVSIYSDHLPSVRCVTFFFESIKVHRGYLPHVALYNCVSNLTRPLWPVTPWCADTYFCSRWPVLPASPDDWGGLYEFIFCLEVCIDVYLAALERWADTGEWGDSDWHESAILSV